MPSGEQEWATLTQGCITEQVTRVGPGPHPAGTSREAPQNCPVKGGRGKVYRFSRPLGHPLSCGVAVPSSFQFTHLCAWQDSACTPGPVCQSPRHQRAGS